MRLSQSSRRASRPPGCWLVAPGLWAQWGARHVPSLAPGCPLTLGSHQHLVGLQGLPRPLRGHGPHAEAVLLALLRLGICEGGAVRRGLAHLQPSAEASLPPLHHIVLQGLAPVIRRGPPGEADASPVAVLHLQGALWGLRLVWGAPRGEGGSEGPQGRGAGLLYQQTRLPGAGGPGWASPRGVPGLHPRHARPRKVTQNAPAPSPDGRGLLPTGSPTSLARLSDTPRAWCVSCRDTWPGSPQSEEGRGQLGVALGLK